MKALQKDPAHLVEVATLHLQSVRLREALVCFEEARVLLDDPPEQLEHLLASLRQLERQYSAIRDDIWFLRDTVDRLPRNLKTRLFRRHLEPLRREAERIAERIALLPNALRTKLQQELLEIGSRLQRKPQRWPWIGLSLLGLSVGLLPLCV